MTSNSGNTNECKEMSTCECLSSKRLRSVGLRPTRQRVALAELIFERGDRHLTAEQLQDDASVNGVSCSLATIYNTLHRFTDAKMLRVLSVDSNKTYFDTNVSDHHHYIVEGSDDVMDIDSSTIDVVGLPDVPEGMEIANVDVIVRLRPKSA